MVSSLAFNINSNQNSTAAITEILERLNSDNVAEAIEAAKEDGRILTHFDLVCPRQNGRLSPTRLLQQTADGDVNEIMASIVPIFFEVQGIVLES